MKANICIESCCDFGLADDDEFYIQFALVFTNHIPTIQYLYISHLTHARKLSLSTYSYPRAFFLFYSNSILNTTSKYS